MKLRIEIAIFVAIAAAAIFIGLRRDELLPASRFLALEADAAESYVMEYSKGAGAVAAWRYLKSIYGAGDSSEGKIDSHELAHLVGKDLFKQQGIKGLSACDQALTMGCYHGFVRALIDSEGPSILAEARDLCKSTPSDGSCVHGVGHSILSAEKGDLSKALQDCDLYMGEFDHACWQGVFMEDQATHEYKDLSWAPCLDVPEKYRAQCASSKPGHLSAIFDQKAVSGLCATAQTPAMKRECYFSMGADIAHRNGGALGIIDLKCGYAAHGIDRDTCYKGAAVNVMSDRGMKVDADVLAICAKISGPSRTTCLD